MSDNTYQKGDIIEGKSTLHPIVFLRKKNEHEFIGCMITHSDSDRYPNNIGFREDDFFKKDDENQDYEIQYDNSYFVEIELIKKNAWGPFLIKGKLTNNGIQHIENYLKDKQKTTWRKYLEK